MALRALVTKVRTVDLTDLLRARRLASMRMRFLADLRLGIDPGSSSACADHVTERGERWR